MAAAPPARFAAGDPPAATLADPSQGRTAGVRACGPFLPGSRSVTVYIGFAKKVHKVMMNGKNGKKLVLILVSIKQDEDV